MSFEPGTRVKVDTRDHDGHHRTPGYVKGQVGPVLKLHGPFRNPEQLAYGLPGSPVKDLYQIEFKLRDLWGERYQGPDSDRLLIDLFEHWLEQVT